MAQSLARLIAKDAELPETIGALLIDSITADSRDVRPGSLFAALPGTKSNGADYIPQAFDNGAVAVVCGMGVYTGGGVAIAVENPRWLLARAAARFYGAQPDTIVAVTGTNGKTSVAVFVRQIWQAMGFRAASLGTVGVVGPLGSEYLQHTTPDAVKLQEIAARLAQDGVEHLAVEASSHGLSQYRLDGLRFTAAAFTNLTRDHLDYHTSLDDYFEAKMRLFSELLPAGAAAVINADSPYAAEVQMRAAAHGISVFTVGHKGRDIRVAEVQQDGLAQVLTLETRHGISQVCLPLIGDFQASNALVAAALVMVSGGEEQTVFRALSSLKGAPGRLDLVGRKDNGAAVFVDYAHTPDALENALRALRPSVKGKLAVVFGCGGDRDKGKRPLMAKAAADAADLVYITDDNPRTEDAASIRQQALAGSPHAIEIADRASCIQTAIEALGVGDILLVAGKGHEEGQIVGTKVLPFSDHEAVRAALRGEIYHA